MPVTNIKQVARQLIDSLPDDAIWEDLMYKIYVQESIEAGTADIKAGRVYTTEEVRERFKIPK
jgi:predicted transcriptional regulator